MKARGFSMVDVMVAVLLTAIAMAAIGSLYALSLRNQTRVLSSTALGNNATMMGQALRSAMASASAIETPPAGQSSITVPPSSGAMLVVWENTDPLTGNSINGGAQTLRQFCLALNRTGSQTNWQDVLYMYVQNGAVWPGNPVLPNACGGPGPGGQPSVIVGGIRGMSIDATFNRSNGNNDLQISYTLNYYPASGENLKPITEITQLTLSGPLQKP